MSYPAAKYLGESGEASAQLRPASTTPDLRRRTGSVSYLATGAKTGGQFGLYHWDFGNEAGGPGPHFHRTLTESFYILAGTVRVYDGTRWVDATRGDYLYVPEGGIHGFEGVAGTNAEMLILFTPGAPREAYFEGIAAGLDRKTTEERAAFFAEHDNYWV